MCKECQNKSKMAAKVGKIKKRRRARVSGPKSDLDMEEILIIATGALGAKMLVNPLGKAIFPNKKESERPKWFPIIMKAGLCYGLSKLDMKEGPLLSKGAALAALLEGAEVFAPTVFAPKLAKNIPQPAPQYDEKGNRINGGYDEENIEINLDDINGYGDLDNWTSEENSLAGVDENESVEMSDVSVM